MTDLPLCPVCSISMTPAFSETVLGRHWVHYFHCPRCGILKTEAPFWREEAYREAIANSDTGLVARNIFHSRWLEPVLHCLLQGKGKYLDVAGGYGLLARLLRDSGFDCYTTDAYCRNLFADGFEPAQGFHADALFAFEVMEHLENPVSFFKEAFEAYQCRTLFFSTQVFHGELPPKDWWYYSFETGQHITFYQPRTLALIAAGLGCQYYPVGGGLHIFSNKVLPKPFLILIRRKRWLGLYGAYVHWVRRGKSKAWEDYLLMKGNP